MRSRLFSSVLKRRLATLFWSTTNCPAIRTERPPPRARAGLSGGHRDGIRTGRPEKQQQAEAQCERKETEEFLSANPSVKNEFELLQKVKLQADNTIVFPGKNLLYKSEEKSKVIPFKWWRLAAAAMLFGAGLWFGINYFQKNDNLPVVVKNDARTKTGKRNPLTSDTITGTPKNPVAESKLPEKKKEELVRRNTGKPSLRQAHLPAPPTTPGSKRAPPKVDHDRIHCRATQREG